MATKTTTIFKPQPLPVFKPAPLPTFKPAPLPVFKATPITTPKVTATPVKTSTGVINKQGQPQYTPNTGVGTKAGNYTYTPNGWQTASTGAPTGVLLGSSQGKATPTTINNKTTTTNTGGNTTTGGTTTSYNSGANNIVAPSYDGGSTTPTIANMMSTATGGTTSTTGAGATKGTTGSATAGDLVTGASYSDGLTNEERDLQRALQERQRYLDEQRNQNVDENTVMNNVLSQFQGEIDATNRVYADKLAEAKITGQNRLGMNRAENFNAGATNSSFANASADRTMQYNDQQYSAIENEKLARIMEIQNNARTLGQKFLADKKASKEAGYTEYINNLNSTKTLKDTIVTKLATNILNSGIDINTIKGSDLTKIAQDSGTTVDAIKSTYQTLKKANDVAVAKAMKDGQFDLSEGESRYDINGKLIAKNNKTYKGTGGGSGGTGSGMSGVSSAAQALALQIQGGQATLAQVPSAMRAEVAKALNAMPSPKIQELDTALNIVDDLRTNPAVTKISGVFDQGIGGFFGKSATAKNLYNQLQGVLALEGRSKLKGSGAISDFEFRVLKDAQSALGRNLSDAEFKRQLNKISEVLTNRKNVLLNTEGNTYAPKATVTAPDGQEIELID